MAIASSPAAAAAGASGGRSSNTRVPAPSSDGPGHNVTYDHLFPPSSPSAAIPATRTDGHAGAASAAACAVGQLYTAAPAEGIAALETRLYVWGYNGQGQTSHAAGMSGHPSTWRCQRTPMPVCVPYTASGSTSRTLRTDHVHTDAAPSASAAARARAAGHGSAGQSEVVANARAKAKAKAVAVVVDVACGLEHTACVASDGSMFTWGRNDYGQLGDGTETDRSHPQAVVALRGEYVTAVACGARCSTAISTCRRAADVREGEPKHGRLWVWGENQNSDLPRLFRGAFPPGMAVRLVACGAAHSAAVSETGLLQTWGYNEAGQLGRGMVSEGLQRAAIVQHYVRYMDDAPVPAASVHIAAVACGDYHTAAIDSITGELYTWGWGQQGQLGHRVLQSGNGTREVLPRRVVALEGTPMASVACGRAHTCAVSQRGALYVWGGGREGQLGTQLSMRAHSHGSHLGGDTAATITAGAEQQQRLRALMAVGGVVGEVSLRVPLQLVAGGVAMVACGTDHTLAATVHGDVLGWGYNSCGQAASGRHSFAWSPTRIHWCVGRVVRIAAGGGHTAVLTAAATLKELCEFAIANNVAAATTALYRLRYSIGHPFLPSHRDGSSSSNKKGGQGCPACDAAAATPLVQLDKAVVVWRSSSSSSSSFSAQQKDAAVAQSDGCGGVAAAAGMCGGVVGALLSKGRVDVSTQIQRAVDLCERVHSETLSLYCQAHWNWLLSGVDLDLDTPHPRRQQQQQKQQRCVCRQQHHRGGHHDEDTHVHHHRYL